MAINFVQKRKSQKYLILVFVILAISAVFILVFGYFGKEKTSSAHISFVQEDFPKIDINFRVLDDFSSFELQSFPALPDVSMQEKAGRENPFSPY